MVKISEKIKSYTAKCKNDPYFSFEFFPPKTEFGVENLYGRIARMTSSGPLFVDVTWGAAGSTKEVTMAICEYVQMYLGIEVLMHLTCSGLKVEDLKKILIEAKNAGIQNILALRGDPPLGSYIWEPVQDGLSNAIDLVRLIRQEHGDYFCIAVAGFPESYSTLPGVGCNIMKELTYLKEKIDAGADFILTQFFYDVDVFTRYCLDCRNEGIMCPIIPGMMPIQSYSSFKKMTTYCRTRVPDKVWNELNPIREDDEAVKAFGVRFCVKMCKDMMKLGVSGFHFYTLNLENSVLAVLKDIGTQTTAARRAFPWRGSRQKLDESGCHEETVRPINWANRPNSYIQRTDSWDEFPNGRWGDVRSPAFGELSNLHFFNPPPFREAVRSQFITSRLNMWGESPLQFKDIYEVFANYIESKIPCLPWCDTPLQLETNTIAFKLAEFNRAGLLTINSQPAVNGEKSDHAVFGWGGLGGYVYQKAYVEMFVSPQLLKTLIQVISLRPNLCLYAVNNSRTNDVVPQDLESHVTALTWGVFRNKEIQQPTVFSVSAFTVWSEEAFQLWINSWASLYDDETDSCGLIYDIHETFYLVAIIDNNYIEPELFSALDEVLKFHQEK